MDVTLSSGPDWPALHAAYPGNALFRPDCPLITVARSVRGRMAYMATPYTLEVLDADQQWDRTRSFEIETRTARWARDLAMEGASVVSPILQACAICHADIEGHLDPLDDCFWARWCQPMMRAAGSVVVPPMTGWDRSRGVWREVCWALEHNVPVYLVAQQPKRGGVHG